MDWMFCVVSFLVTSVCDIAPYWQNYWDMTYKLLFFSKNPQFFEHLLACTTFIVIVTRNFYELVMDYVSLNALPQVLTKQSENLNSKVITVFSIFLKLSFIVFKLYRKFKCNLLKFLKDYFCFPEWILSFLQIGEWLTKWTVFYIS